MPVGIAIAGTTAGGITTDSSGICSRLVGLDVLLDLLSLARGHAPIFPGSLEL